ECAPRAKLDERFEVLLERIARMPINQLVMMKLMLNQAAYAQGLAQSQLLGTVFDGIARHTAEGYGFASRAAEAGFRTAVRERDEHRRVVSGLSRRDARAAPRSRGAGQARGDRPAMRRGRRRRGRAAVAAYRRGRVQDDRAVPHLARGSLARDPGTAAALP